MHNGLWDILESGNVTQIVKGMIFTEGPVWHKEGYLTFVDLRRNMLLRWQPGVDVQIIRENTNGGNGCTLDKEGRLLMCEGGNQRVTRWEFDGTWTTVAEAWQGKRLNRPNDVICRSDGLVYFTDPAMLQTPELVELDMSPVWRLAPDGKLDAAFASSQDCPYPNGLALSPDEKILYVMNSRLEKACMEKWRRNEVCTHRYVVALDVQPDGSLHNQRKFADMSSSDEGVPDGMKVDCNGNLFCTGSGGTWVFDSKGNKLGVLRTPEVPANCAFGGEDLRTLFFAAQTSVYTMRVKIPGLRKF